MFAGSGKGVGGSDALRYPMTQLDHVLMGYAIVKSKKTDKRKTAAQRGYGSRWRRERAEFLRDHPLCRMCQANGIVTAATLVDHIIPHRGRERLFWDRDNWQPL